MVNLKYPKCKICREIRKVFFESDVPTEWINDYHESKKTIDDLPKRVQDDVLDIVLQLTKET